MTIIFSNRLDDDSRVLKDIWQDIPNINLIEILPDSTDWEDIVNDAIYKEKDTVILVGHGSPYGLYFPRYETGEYLVHENNVNLINAKQVICCWCYASSFCRSQNIDSFATSMFISNVKEAYDNCIYDVTQEYINNTCHSFYQEINYLLKNDIPLDEWVMRLGAHMDVENSIDFFNRTGIEKI